MSSSKTLIASSNSLILAFFSSVNLSFSSILSFFFSAKKLIFSCTIFFLSSNSVTSFSSEVIYIWILLICSSVLWKTIGRSSILSTPVYSIILLKASLIISAFFEYFSIIYFLNLFIYFHLFTTSSIIGVLSEISSAASNFICLSNSFAFAPLNNAFVSETIDNICLFLACSFFSSLSLFIYSSINLWYSSSNSSLLSSNCFCCAFPVSTLLFNSAVFIFPFAFSFFLFISSNSCCFSIFDCLIASLCAIAIFFCFLKLIICCFKSSFPKIIPLISFVKISKWSWFFAIAFLVFSCSSASSLSFPFFLFIGS